VTVQRAFFLGGGITPRRLGKSCHDNLADPDVGTLSRGATNLVGPTACLCGLSTRQGIVPDQLKLTDREKYTHGEGSDQLPRTEINSGPRHKGVAESVGPWRLEPKVYELCYFRLKDFSA
jgi:hypothetical protein